MTKSDNSQEELTDLLADLKQRIVELEEEKVAYTQVYCVVDPTVACFLTHTYLPDKTKPLPNSWAIKPKERLETLNKLYELALHSIIQSHAGVLNQIGTHIEFYVDQTEAERIHDSNALAEFVDNSPVHIIISFPKAKKRFNLAKQDIQKRIDNAISNRPHPDSSSS